MFKLLKWLTSTAWKGGKSPICLVPGQSIGVDTPCFHVFGDSHSRFYSTTPRVVVHHIGPVTMHRVGRDGLDLFDFSGCSFNDGDALGFCFGEIDIRVHVALQRDLNERSPDQIIKDLVSAYLTTLRTAKKTFPSCMIVALAAVPPAGKDYPSFDPTHPRNGTDKERGAWTAKLNALLRVGAVKSNILFLDQYKSFVDRQGMLDRRFTTDGVHVDPTLLNPSVNLPYII
jgi:hypothetical protein